ncbi:hypothetical protein C7S18_09120 [Ahniella affigens]|uniref:Uncharacterized protein n=1 Tax=Ahniella affigens TaxID=2021234 RepID=A0A2P1PR79_9GAMM|nr:hypothetical protein C7S18_09120 [Ahniella affigens]
MALAGDIARGTLSQVRGHARLSVRAGLIQAPLCGAMPPAQAIHAADGDKVRMSCILPAL